jgi:hypothetical protein
MRTFATPFLLAFLLLGQSGLALAAEQWNQDRLKLEYADCARQLRQGDPSIEVNTGNAGLNLASYNLVSG